MAKAKVGAQLVELREAISEAELLTKQESLTKRDEARVNFLLAKIAALRKVNAEDFVEIVEENIGHRFSVSETEKRWFAALQVSEDEALRVLNPTFNDQEIRQLVREQRDMLAGTQTITYTQSQLGGTLIPNEFVEEIFLGLAEVDPLLDKRWVTLLETKGARPTRYPSLDL